jgi:hypothetical protein
MLLFLLLLIRLTIVVEDPCNDQMNWTYDLLYFSTDALKRSQSQYGSHIDCASVGRQSSRCSMMVASPECNFATPWVEMIMSCCSLCRAGQKLCNLD